MPRKSSSKKASKATADSPAKPVFGSLLYRFVALGVPISKPIEDMYKYFSQFGEVKFCVRLSSDIQLDELGDLEPVSLEILRVAGSAGVTSVKYNLLVEVSEADTIQKAAAILPQLYPVVPLHKHSPLCDRLIEEVHTRKIFVFGLKKSIDEPKLHELFAGFGQIEAVRIVRNSNDFRSKGYGFIIYKDTKGRQASLQCGGFPYEDKFIQWIPYRDDSKNSQKQHKFAPSASTKGGESTPQHHVYVWAEKPLTRQDTGTLVHSSSKESNPVFSEHQTVSDNNLPFAASRSPNKGRWERAPDRDSDSQYKFNRSRIISSAAVREYFFRYYFTSSAQFGSQSRTPPCF